MVGHSVYVYASSFKYHCVSKLYKTNDVNIWDSDASSYLLYDANFLGVSVSSPRYYISREDSVITSIYFLISFVNGEINFMYPGGNEPFNAYRYNLSFGE